ncbi:SDR family oxidoreductase [Henriciella litoralis]|uniref:SDR family oxidoreductase n=1 Tax=Henriciella litoralis TaxID=568102 RepID=UPI000A039485
MPKPPEPRNLLAGKTALITAAAGTGIGFSTASRFAREGATVFISDIHEGRLAKAADALEAETGIRPATAICNVTKQEEVDALFKAAEAELGAIDVVVNNAGLGGTADLVDMTDEQWMVVLDVTLNSCFRMTRAGMQHMRGHGGGVIVNNASVLGWRAQKGQAHYAAAKAGVMALTRCAGVEGAELGVRVNAVAPSLAMHPFLHKVTSPELLAELEAKEAYGRAADVWEIATVIAFLASDYSTYMTGEIVSVSSQRA